MNINPIAALFPSYLSPNNTANAANNASSASSVQQQADVFGLSPSAQFLNQLQQLQKQSPQQFQAVISQLTGQLQQAAGTATKDGNTAQSNQFTQLANSFHSAAKGGLLPTALQLQQAGLTGQHQHRVGYQGSLRLNAVNAFQAANNAGLQDQSVLSSIFQL